MEDCSLLSVYTSSGVSAVTAVVTQSCQLASPLSWPICMENDVIASGTGREPLASQAAYLSGVLSRKNISAREIARRTKMLAEECAKPELAVGHQAVSGWVKGSRRPTLEHRRVLATVLDIPLEELNRACEPDKGLLTLWPAFKSTTIVVHGEFQRYEYKLMVRREIDISRPALYQQWTEMFSCPPVSLTRHLRHVSYNLFGWIPNQTASPMVHYPRCLVPVEAVSGRDGLRMLDSAKSNQRRVWFVYLPDGNLHVGIGCRDGRSFALFRNHSKGIAIERYPLSRIELVGHVVGNILFHIETDVSNSLNNGKADVTKKAI